MYRDLTKGNITKGLLLFALPMIAGNLLQQFYNIADTLIVGQALGKNALAAVGSAYTLMTFLTSIFLGLASERGLACAGPDLCGDGGAQHFGLRVFRPDSALSANPGGAVRFDAGVPCDHFCGAHRDVSL